MELSCRLDYSYSSSYTPRWPDGSITGNEYGFTGGDVETEVLWHYQSENSNGSWLARALTETPSPLYPEDYLSAADYVVANLIPDLADHATSLKVLLEEMVDEDGLQVIGCLTFIALEVVRIAASKHARLEWDDIRRLVWLHIDEFDDVLIYPMGLPTSPLHQLALSDSDEVIVISSSRRPT